MTRRDNEGIPYLTSAAEGMVGLLPSKTISSDEENYDTLRAIYLILKEGLAEIDNFHAFDLKENEMNIKQQIKAHKLAYDLVAPLFDSVEAAMELVNQKYKDK